MPLKRAESWTDIYYSSIEEYFWRPQAIGRKSDPAAVSQPWTHWRSKLASQEVALNHILDFLFHVAPPELLENIVESFIGHKINGVDLVSASPGLIEDSVVQPDIILSNGESLNFIEMKVDSKSSVDQFTKYLIAAYCITEDDPSISTINLIMLCAHNDFPKIWRKSKALGISSPRDLVQVAIQGLKGDDSVWSERGVPRFLSKNPESVEKLLSLANQTNVYLTNYECLATTLRQFATEEPTAKKLVQGAVLELERRCLVKPR